MSETSFQLKGSVVTTFILELYRYSREGFTQQLKDKISQAPEFFHQSPLVISLEKTSVDEGDIDFTELLGICRQLQLQPLAFKSVDESFAEAVKLTGLAIVSDSATSRSSARAVKIQKEAEVVGSAENAEPVDEEKPAYRKSKVIQRPVRSGQQVYAEGADLIILSQVSEGAEVLADGNIHVYGSLRGRALAGIKGDRHARVFCQKLEAELISVAGHFILSDSLDKALKGQAVQAYLDEQTLHVKPV